MFAETIADKEKKIVELMAEIERLREALIRIADGLEDPRFVAFEALGMDRKTPS